MAIYKQVIVKDKSGYEIRFNTHNQFYIIVASLIITRKELPITYYLFSMNYIL